MGLGRNMFLYDWTLKTVGFAVSTPSHENDLRRPIINHSHFFVTQGVVQSW